MKASILLMRLPFRFDCTVINKSDGTNSYYGRTHTSSSAAEISCPEGVARGTRKNLFFRIRTTWLWVAGSNLRAMSDGFVGYREAWKLQNQGFNMKEHQKQAAGRSY